MAAEGMQFSWRWNGGTISLNLGVIWEMSVNQVVEGGPHKTKEEELIAELESLRQRLGDLEQMVEGRENEDVPSEPFGDLNRIYREAPIGLCYLDTDLRFLQINDWMAAINGLSVEDHLGRTIGEVLPDIAAGVEAQFRRVLETGEPILEGTVEAETPARPGIRKTFQHNYYPLKSGDGTVVGVSCVVQDITERKRAEKELENAHDVLESKVKERTSELTDTNRKLRSETAERIRHADRYKSLLDAAPDPTVSVDHEGKIIEINTQVERVLGYGRDELIGQGVELLVPDQLRGRHIQHRQAYSRDPHSRAMGTGLELVVRCKSGQELPVEVSLSPSRLSEDRVVIASIRDISQRREISKVLEETKEHYRRLLESTVAMPWEADARTWMFTYVGPQAVELLGYPRELWLEKDFWVEHIHPEDRAKTIDDCLKFTAQRENYEIEYRMIMANGRAIWLQDIVNVVKQEGEPVILQGFLIDITERKSLEELRRNISARLIGAQEEERIKISRELHDDFGQRLALLAVEIQRLGQKISEPEFEGARSMDKLWLQARELSTDLYRLSHQLHPAILYQLGLGPSIRSLCNEISKQHGIQIKFTEHEVPASISQDIALCLYRIVQEGLRNIVKHSGAKDAKVELTGGPDTIHLRIADRGVGFDPATTKGKGIGLVSIEERVRLVQGEMSLQSRPSHGTCIDLRIPSAVPDA
jgi:PAS domain S-box-containing protein